MSCSDLKDRCLKIISEIVPYLDDSSRYIAELKDPITAAVDADSLFSLIRNGERISRFVPNITRQSLQLEQLIHLSLITPETYWMRFSEDEQAAIVSIIESMPTNALIISAPCSVGLEVISLAVLTERAGRHNSIQLQGVDLIPEFFSSFNLETLRKFVPAEFHNFLETLDQQRITFTCHDLIEKPLSPGLPPSLILCRNFLGFLKPPIQKQVVRHLVYNADCPQYLLFDQFCMNSEKCEATREAVKDYGFTQSAQLPTLWRRGSIASKSITNSIN
jgi:chemotaxis methyl-accepting protein methylase